jgi:hypothetical protein
VDARRAWHLAAIAAFALAAAVHTHGWLTGDLMPGGDFPGYAAQVQYVRDALLEHGRVPEWCIECYGGTTNFTSNLKEYFAFPLALAFDSVLATKLAFVLLRVIGALGMYWLVARELGAPAVGIAAGYAYSYGAVANYQIQHLDVAVATAILPFLWLSAVELLRSGGARWAVALGVGMACQLANNWVHAATAPLAVLALALVRPWRIGDGEPAPWRDAALARRWAVRGLAAFAVFCAFAASPVAWLAGDASHHGLMPSDTIVLQRLFYVERSPFLFVNRDDALGHWLETHHPPYRRFPDGGRRYLGGVLLAVIAAGAWVARRDPPARRWAAIAAAAWLLQYWLALGPRTLLWQVAESLHFGPEAQAHAVIALRSAAALCAIAAAAHAAWRRRDRGRAARSSRAGSLIAAAILLVMPTASLWNACASFLPMFAMQRSPGHFFDTTPFMLSLCFAACLAAIARRAARRRLGTALVAAVAAALVLDYWPSTNAFTSGTPLAPLRESAAIVADLPADGGMLRIGVGPGYSPLASWMLAQSRAGHAWGWIFWQAGQYWRDAYAFAAFGEIDPSGAAPWNERYQPLLAAARVRHVLIERGATPPREPWRPVRHDQRVTLFEGPEVPPVALAYHTWVLWTGDDPTRAADAAAAGLRVNALLVVPPADPTAAAALRARAAFALSSSPALPLLAPPAPAPTEVAYRRPAPERIELELDARDAPALAFVSEGYHPWWRASVDGDAAPVLRASIAHMAVLVGPGRHAIELRLVRPVLVAAADWLTAGAWLALAGRLIVSLVGRIRSEGP